MEGGFFSTKVFSATPSETGRKTKRPSPRRPMPTGGESPVNSHPQKSPTPADRRRVPRADRHSHVAPFARQGRGARATGTGDRRNDSRYAARRGAVAIHQGVSDLTEPAFIVGGVQHINLKWAPDPGQQVGSTRRL